jgi:hypothetical protein
MLWNASVLKSFTIAASDGHIGTVSDFLFDDANWQIRWLVVDAGNWFSGRKVLLAPLILEQLDTKHRALTVELTMQQIMDSPEVDTELPMSRRMEIDCYIRAAWMVPCNQTLGQKPSENNIAIQQSSGDPHLRSTEAITGYYIHASDGEIGHIEGFLLRDADWSIPYVIVDTKNWWPGKKVLISPQSIREIDFTGQLVNLNIKRQTVKDSPPYDSSTIIDAAYDDAFLAYYGLRLIAA